MTDEKFIEQMLNLRLDEMNYKELIEYLFEQYNASSDKQFKDFYFKRLAEVITGTKKPNDEPIKILDEYEDIIVQAAYKYLYEDMSSLKGPLLNALNEILIGNDSQEYISHYIELMKILMRYGNRPDRTPNYLP